MPPPKLLCLLYCLSFFTNCFSQAIIPFTGCPDVYVIAFKNGTSCSKTPYNFYQSDENGNLLGPPFATTADTVEINGIGINPVDGFFYGLRYERSASCVFSMIKVIKMDAVGGITVLGSIRPPEGGTVSSPVGVVSINDKYIFSAAVGPTTYIGAISNISSLATPANDTLDAVYTPIINNCPGKIYSDWALKYGSGLLYTYGIYSDGGVVTGTVIKINAATGMLDCTGTPNTTEFLDISRDNFGGLMFGANGFLYGFNVNTRKYYKIDVVTGNILQVNSVPGGGQLRGDLGSCATGFIVLPVTLNSFKISQKNCTALLEWKTGSEKNLHGFEIERSLDGSTFNVIKHFNNSGNYDGSNYSFLDNAAEDKLYYRLKMTNQNGDYKYSDIVIFKKECSNTLNEKKIQLSIFDNNLRLKFFSLKNEKIMMQIISNDGRIVQVNNINVHAGENNFTIPLNAAAGAYTLKTSIAQKVFINKFIKN